MSFSRWTNLTVIAAVFLFIQSRCCNAQSDPGDVIGTVFNPDPMPFATFGATLGTLGDDVVIGALGAKRGSFFEGAVYLVEGTGPNLGQVIHELRRPMPQDTDRVAHALATFGNSIIVADPRYGIPGVESAGAVHIYDSISGNHVRTIHNPSPFRMDLFGWDIATLGSILIVSELSEQLDDPKVYVFDIASGNLVRTIDKPATADDFGRALAVVGQEIFVGAPRDEPNAALTNSGSVFAFDSLTGSLIRKIDNPTPANFEEFGSEIVGVGEKLVIGGFSDEAYVYEANSGVLLDTITDPGTNNTHFGSILAPYGDRLLASSRFGPEAYVIDLEFGSSLLSFDVPGASDFPAQVGAFLSLADLNGNIVVGNPAWDTGTGFPTDEGRVFIVKGIPEPPASLLVACGFALLVGVSRFREQAISPRAD
jgi:hypothetical protein